MKTTLRGTLKGLFILAVGPVRASAEQAHAEGRADLVAFGRPILSNPDLVARMQQNAALNPPDMATFYTPGPKGYTDYPTLSS
jgi:N-ethylmaleimide reductase